MRRFVNLEMGFCPSGLLATLFWQAASFSFCPWRKPLIALIVWIVGNLRMCVFSQSVCALWPALSMAFMIVLSAMLWFLRPHGVPRHFVHSNSAKMVNEFTCLRKDQVHCPGCSDDTKEATSSSANHLPSFIFTAWISLPDVLLIAASKS